MLQYLFAVFSLKQSTDEGLTEDELAAVQRWRKVVAHVATDEMLHLTLVQNLLSAIGSAPHFSRPNLPAPAKHYPAGVRLTLMPFGEEALRHFMFLERPEGMSLRGATGLDDALAEAAPVVDEADIVPRGQDFRQFLAGGVVTVEHHGQRPGRDVLDEAHQQAAEDRRPLQGRLEPRVCGAEDRAVLHVEREADRSPVIAARYELAEDLDVVVPGVEEAFVERLLERHHHCRDRAGNAASQAGLQHRSSISGVLRWNNRRPR
jgi:hypothetical protein